MRQLRVQEVHVRNPKTVLRERTRTSEAGHECWKSREHVTQCFYGENYHICARG